MQRVIFEGLLHTRTNLCITFYNALKNINWSLLHDDANTRGMADTLAGLYVDTVENEIHTQMVACTSNLGWDTMTEACNSISDDVDCFINDYLGVTSYPPHYDEAFDSIITALQCAVGAIPYPVWVDLIKTNQELIKSTACNFGAVAWVSSVGVSPHNDSFYFIRSHDMTLLRTVEYGELPKEETISTLSDVVYFLESECSIDYNHGPDIYVVFSGETFLPGLDSDLMKNQDIHIYKVKRSTM